MSLLFYYNILKGEGNSPVIPPPLLDWYRPNRRPFSKKGMRKANRAEFEVFVLPKCETNKDPT